MWKALLFHLWILGRKFFVFLHDVDFLWDSRFKFCVLQVSQIGMSFRLVLRNVNMKLYVE